MNAVASPLQVAPAIGDGWAARLALAFERRAQGTVLTHVRHSGPLTVQRALYPEGRDACHAVVVHPPGGVAGGDTLDVDIAVRERAHAVLTMPGAAKFYRCDGKTSRQRIAIRIEGGAVVEWLPPETIVFDGAHARASLEIDVDASGGLLGWDIVALGRRARGETFRQGRWRQRLALRRGGRLVVDDTLDVVGDDRWLQARVGLDGHSVVATLFAVSDAIDAGLVQACRDAIDGTTMRVGVTMPVPGVLVARCLADEAESARGVLTAMWARLRLPLTGLPARPLRLWAT